MSRIVVRQEPDGACEVWICLVDGDPTRMSESFIIGVGATREAAVVEAIADLSTCVAELQGPLLPPGHSDPRD